MTDFIIDYEEDGEKVGNKILTNLLIKKIEAGMPLVIIIKGKSGTGKTRFALKLQDLLYKHYGLDFVEYMKMCVIIKPSDFIDKIKPLIERNSDPPYNKIKSIHLDESKFVISADEFQSIQNKGIRTIIATSRAIRPFVFIVLCQLLKDIDARTREQADYIFTVKRSPGHKPSIDCMIPYEHIIDLNKINVKLRPLVGTYKMEDGSTESHVPNFRPTLPRKEIEDAYISFEREDKKVQLLEMLDSMEKDINKATDKGKKKLKDLVDYFVKNPNQLEEFGKFSEKTGKWKFGKDATVKLNFTQREFREMEGMLIEKMSNKLGGDINAMAEQSATNIQ